MAALLDHVLLDGKRRLADRHLILHAQERGVVELTVRGPLGGGFVEGLTRLAAQAPRVAATAIGAVVVCAFGCRRRRSRAPVIARFVVTAPTPAATEQGQ